MNSSPTGNWIADYFAKQRETIASLPLDQIEQLIDMVREAHEKDRRIFIIGNGGNASNATHFATDLGKGASDVLVKKESSKRIHVQSLTDNVSWLTAVGNDDDYASVFRRQLENIARPNDLLFAGSVSGSSPNLVEAMQWANNHGMHTIALIGGVRGELADVAKTVIVVNDTHYGRVEDAQMMIYHAICYCLMEVDD